MRWSRPAIASALAGLAVATAPASGNAAVTDGLTLRQLAGQRVIFGFAGPSPPQALRDRIRRGEIAGVILFKRHIRSRSALRAMVTDLQAIPRPEGLRDPLLVMIDQEGGAVKRLDGAPSRSPEQIGRTGSEVIARSEGLAAARNLRSVRVNVNLAPVLDLGTAGSYVARLDRAFSAKPDVVSRLGTAFSNGLADGDVAAAAKHFPGNSRAGENEDIVSARIDTPRAELRRRDEAPFAAAVKSQVPLVMVSTARFTAFGQRPALFSRKLTTTELRDRLGFTGVSITDDLEVPAMAGYGPAARKAELAARAGADLLLFAQSYGAGAAGVEAVVDGVGANRLSRTELEQSAARVLALRASLR